MHWVNLYLTGATLTAFGAGTSYGRNYRRWDGMGWGWHWAAVCVWPLTWICMAAHGFAETVDGALK